MKEINETETAIGQLGKKELIGENRCSKQASYNHEQEDTNRTWRKWEDSTQRWRWLQTEKQEEEGKLNRDIVRRLVKRKQKRNGRLKENCVYRQHSQTKLFTVKRATRIRKGVFCWSWLFKKLVSTQLYLITFSKLLQQQYRVPITTFLNETKLPITVVGQLFVIYCQLPNNFWKQITSYHVHGL